MSNDVSVFMSFYVGDYIKKTSMLSCTEHGAYLLILFSLWMHDGKLPSNRRKLALICRLSDEEFADVWDSISIYFNESDGMITNSRVLEELEKAQKRREKAKENGAKGGRPKTQEKPSGLATGIPSGIPSGLARTKAKPNPKKSSSPSHSDVTDIPNGISVTKEMHKEKFTPPTWEEVFDYMRYLATKPVEPGRAEIKYYRLPKEELSKFFDHYQSRDWKDNDGIKIISWKGRLVSWINFWLSKNPEVI